MKSFQNLKEELNQPSEQLIEDVMTMLAIRNTDSIELYEAFDADCDTILNEGIVDFLKLDVKDVAKKLDDLLGKGLGKAGLHRHKGKGLISHILSAGKGVGKLVLAAVKGDAETVKEISKSVKKADVIDFLLKLDTVTMHLVTGPIHALDAWTGWHIGADLEHAIKGKDGIIAKIKGAIKTIRTGLADVIDKTRVAVFHKGMDKLEAEIS